MKTEEDVCGHFVDNILKVRSEFSVYKLVTEFSLFDVFNVHFSMFIVATLQLIRIQ